ncbi:hypothetical protein GGI25_005109 [Coemansia spiralis]|uniref:Tyrosinase copper-binding domain-containing protein n=2 Tax=Coemansia TaxID=4863 RepID=A0A9W8G3W1_9FUNG|nr:hypothetical protein BX070DRAFT_255771 [Coemansia spiralis]KAJ1988921.1 hypothetical protein EDC05_005016 [Coemansia umbellata]KAJ2620022.1 hypothetical protein GGI26_005371 [Coemansia sp. RSA 1358]KAJ2672506.1 hypothetical protein GGI25_005109 [Coemansia spiralis]
MHQDGQFDRFAKSHDAVFDQVHGTSAFFPFHRRFVLEFENIGRQIDPDFVVPYWDSTRDYRRPADSPILRGGTLGGNGQGPDACVSDGIQGGWVVSFPNRHCLQRSFNQGNSIMPWIPAEVISSFVQGDDDLAGFREHIEFSIHGAVHLGLGGDASTPFAPNDFFFYMHHANIDRLWWLWQNGQNTPFKYNGPGAFGEARLDDPIPQDHTVELGHGSVKSVMVLGYNDICYSYDSAPAPPNDYPGGSNTKSANTTFAELPIFSGSSVAAGNPLELARIRKALNEQHMLRDYFPRSALLGPPTREEIAEPSDVSRCECLKKKARILYPARMSESWIRMHGFNAERVEQLYQEACRLIDLLNNGTYISPY